MNSLLDNIILTIGFILFVSVTITLLSGGLRLLYQYKIDDSKFKILLLGIVPIVQIKFTNIAKINKIDNNTLFDYPFALQFWNKFRTAEYVIIEQRNYILIKYLVITPEDTDQFIKVINCRINRDE